MTRIIKDETLILTITVG